MTKRSGLKEVVSARNDPECAPAVPGHSLLSRMVGRSVTAMALRRSFRLRYPFDFHVPLQRDLFLPRRVPTPGRRPDVATPPFPTARDRTSLFRSCATELVDLFPTAVWSPVRFRDRPESTHRPSLWVDPESHTGPTVRVLRPLSSYGPPPLSVPRQPCGRVCPRTRRRPLSAVSDSVVSVESLTCRRTRHERSNREGYNYLKGKFI